MGNSSVAQKFSSLQPVPLVDTDKRFKFWNMYDGVVQKTNNADARSVSVFEFNLSEKIAKDLHKTIQRTKPPTDEEKPPVEKNKKISPLEEEPAKTIIECARRGLKVCLILELSFSNIE